MTKRDLIDEVNKRFPHLSRRDSEVIINAIFDSMVDALAQGDRIEIRGFGSFVVKQRRARQGCCRTSCSTREQGRWRATPAPSP